MPNVFRNIPSVSELLEHAPLKQLSQSLNRNAVVDGVRDFLERLRRDLQTAASEAGVPNPGDLAQQIAAWIERSEATSGLRPVVNATGILLHTGLGRAPLATAAIQSLASLGGGYVNLEFDLDSGQRARREELIARRLQRLTGAEAALVVNNNAAATLLTLTALCSGREVIVSRGQLVEIGGSYRLPDVMTTSGALLREVGTTNKTRLDDYRHAIRPETAALMRVHPSNYAIVGFTEQASLKELAALARQHHLPLIDDVGSGALVDLAKYGVSDEPVVSRSLETGADVVLFSGDKLLGGPQAGIIVGRSEPLQAIRQHPLMRAMRVGKLTLAALDATLQLYEDPEQLEQALPLLGMLATSVENLEQRAQRLAPQLAALAAIATAEVVPEQACLGGGSVPAQNLPTRCIAITPTKGTIDQLARQLRVGTPSVVGRVRQDRLLLDLRSVPPAADLQLLAACQQLGEGNHPPK